MVARAKPLAEKAAFRLNLSTCPVRKFRLKTTALNCSSDLYALHHPRNAGRNGRHAAGVEAGRHFAVFEHGRAPDAAVQKWQDRLNGVWGALPAGAISTAIFRH